MVLNENRWYVLDNLIWGLYKIGLIPKKGNYDLIYKETYNIDEVDFSKRLECIKLCRKQLNILKKLPVIEQRTKEWFDMRLNMLTASDTYNAMIKSKHLVRNKALKIQNHIKCDALTWGIMFEPIATDIYSKENNDINIYDFGVIRSKDPDIAFYGASPDGITSLGTMLEIKCPISRKIIPGNIKKNYMAQVQGQMAVCELNECDFGEFEFEKIDLMQFLNIDIKDIRYFGCILVNQNDNTKFDHYTKLHLAPIDCYLDVLKLNANKTQKIIYWKLNSMNIQRVMFDKKQWDELYKPKIIDFWNVVNNYTEPEIFRSDSDD